LNYGSLDGGFYTATGIVPNIKFFVTTQATLLLKGGGCGVAAKSPHHTPHFVAG